VATEGVRGLEPGSRPALIVSELQRGIVDPTLADLPGLAGHVTSRRVPERIGRLADAARAHAVPRALRVTTVVLTGVSTNVALTGGAIEAVNRGYQVVLPADCTAGSSAEAHARHLDEFFSLMGAVTDSDAVAAAFARL
jgi:nicotinamidase-related amidase